MDRPASPDPERMLAAAEDEGEDEALERYSHGVASVQSILALDKLRQEVAVKEKLAEMGRPLKKLPPPIPPKPLVSLSRADSGLLDTLALGDNGEEETARSPIESGTCGVSPGCLASAISSLEEVSHDEFTVSACTTNVSVVKNNIPGIEIEIAHHQDRDVQFDQAVFSPWIHTPVFESGTNPKTSTPIAKPASGNETFTNESVLSGNSKVKEIIRRIPNDIKVNVTNAQVKPQLSLKDEVTTESADYRSPASERSEGAMISQTQSSLSDQSETQGNDSHFECKQSEDRLPLPSLDQDTQQPPLNHITISDECVALPKSKISQPTSQNDVELQSGDHFSQTVQSIAQPNSQIDQQSFSEKASGSQSQLCQSESQSSQITGEQTDLQTSNETMVNTEESVDAQPVEKETRNKIEHEQTENETGRKNMNSALEKAASPHEEIDVPKEPSDQRMEDIGDHSGVNNLSTPKPTLPLMRGFTYQTVEVKDSRQILVSADPKIDAKETAPNLVSEIKSESCGVVKIESMPISSNRVQLTGHGNVVHQDMTDATTSAIEPVVNMLENSGVASHMVEATCSKQKLSEGHEKTEESSLTEVNRTIEIEESEQNEHNEEIQINPRENDEEQITAEMSQDTSEQNIQQEPSELTTSRPEYDLKEKVGVYQVQDSNESSQTENIENQDSGMPRSRAETPSETSDSGSVASSTELLDEPAVSQHASNTPPIKPAIVADSKSKQTVSVGEVVMADLGKQGYKMGVVKFVGETRFQPGEWIGVALDRPNGKHNGSVQGVSYFKCKQKHGVFVKIDKIMKAPDLSASKSTTATATPMSVSRSPAIAKRTVLSGMKRLPTTASAFKHKRNTSGLK